MAAPLVNWKEAQQKAMWLAETKGEMRPNVAFRNQAAESWCEKMSATKYGRWKISLRTADAARVCTRK